jgi:hypothetical protein
VITHYYIILVLISLRCVTTTVIGDATTTSSSVTNGHTVAPAQAPLQLFVLSKLPVPVLKASLV